MQERLIHDVAFVMAIELVERLNLRPEERIEARREFYEICKAGIETYEIQKTRVLHRLNPTGN